MSTTAMTLLADYRIPDFLIEKTHLTFELHEGYTDVSSQLSMVRNPKGDQAAHAVLHGEQLELLALAINDRALQPTDYQCTAHTLTIYNVEERFVLHCKTRIYPEKNTALEGLYRSSGMYCTQCEAEGFRKITYYLDRPDVMSEFDTIIIADEGAFSVMLSNGNCLSDRIENGKRIVHWHDPFKKPSYLFALVSGNLSCLEDRFVTQSGRDVLLQIYTEAKDQDKCDFAMQSLKNAMRWDEEVYGREYDLDRFMIVAVDDFNMGAMENKGLNIFNTSCVLAHPATTTDAGFQRVESVVAHEYFHNWSGNRVTCRDWFQLSLKEGFTVFRDSEFSADMNSRTVKRVEDVSFLRTLQFAEDAGPMAHPVRPASYMEISNFYTLTIYEKGAEVVRMLARLLGPELFRQGSDLYFDRHDGQAVTIEDFLAVMEQVSGRDLSQFQRWYDQAGTPVLNVRDHYDAETQRYSLTLSQQTPATAERQQKLPFHIPVAMGLIGKTAELGLQLVGEPRPEDARAVTSMILELTESEQTFEFEQVSERPIPSLLRGFSAPVKLRYDYTREALAGLMAADSDGFTRWEASQSLALQVIDDAISAYRDQGLEDFKVDPLFTSALHDLWQSPPEDKAMLALMLQLPEESYIGEQYAVVDVEAIHLARQAVATQVAEALRSEFSQCLLAYDHRRVYSPAAAEVAERSLKNLALTYSMIAPDADTLAHCQRFFQQANNMTDQLAALKALTMCQ